VKKPVVIRRLIGSLVTILGLMLVWYPLNFWWSLRSAVAEAEGEGRHTFIYTIGDGSISASMFHILLAGVLLAGLVLISVGTLMIRRPGMKS
jgi:hypothetical protein